MKNKILQLCLTYTNNYYFCKNKFSKMAELNNKGLKAVIVVLLLLLVGSVAYIFKLNNDLSLKKVEVTTVVSEKDKVIADLNALKVTYDAAILENTSISDQLIAERDKVVLLMDEVKKSKGGGEILSRFKQKYAELEEVKKAMLLQVDELTKKNSKLASQRDSTITVLDVEKLTNQTLQGQNIEMNKKIQSAAKISIMAPKGTAYTVKSSGKKETDKASKTDEIKVSFMIPENKLAKEGVREFYIQVIDGANNVLGEKASVNMDGKILIYSMISTVNYTNSTIQKNELIQGTDFPKGNYTINIFDKNELLNSSMFILK